MIKTIIKAADVVGTVAPTGAFVNGGSNYLADKVQDFINAFIGVVIIAAVVGLIYNGLMFITAGGESSKVSKATNGIIYSLIGLGVALSAGLVVAFFKDMF